MPQISGRQSPAGKPKPVDQVRTEHCSLSTEEACIQWTRRFILFHSKRHPREMCPRETNASLSSLAVARRVSASTHNQRTGMERRHHIHERALQRTAKEAVRKAGIKKKASCYTLHSFAAHLLEEGYGIRTVQESLGNEDVITAMTYTHVLNKGGKGVRSPVVLLP